MSRPAPHPARLGLPNTLTAKALQKETESSYWFHRIVQRLPDPAIWNNARLNMTTPPEMRGLAQRLLDYEAFADTSSELAESATLRVYEKLRRSLGEFAGVAGFQSLASRALALARTDAPSLSAVQVSADGALQGLGEIEHRFDIEKVRAGEFPACEGEIVLVARLLGLLLIFLGEPVTLRILRNVWPGAAFDDCNSENGRKAWTP